MITEAETPQEAETPACAFEVAAADAESRLALAKEIGKFLRRAVTGQPRGSSGRDRLKLQNRCYLVVADFEGKALAEPKFLTSFQEVKAICKRGSEAGDSVFVGLPTKWEAKSGADCGGLPSACGPSQCLSLQASRLKWPRLFWCKSQGCQLRTHSVAHFTYVLAEELHAVNLVPIAVHSEFRSY